MENTTKIDGKVAKLNHSGFEYTINHDRVIGWCSDWVDGYNDRIANDMIETKTYPSCYGHTDGIATDSLINESEIVRIFKS